MRRFLKHDIFDDEFESEFMRFHAEANDHYDKQEKEGVKKLQDSEIPEEIKTFDYMIDELYFFLAHAEYSDDELYYHTEALMDTYVDRGEPYPIQGLQYNW